MNINPKNMLEMLKKASLGGLNKDCVITSDMEGSAIIAIDESQTIYCHSSCNESLGEVTLGIGKLDVLMKYLSGVPTDTVMASVQDNRLVFTGTNSNFRYLLSDPKSIRCQLEEPPLDGEDYTQISQECPFSIELTDDDRAYVTKMMAISHPRTITIKIGQRGRVVIEGGSENEHSFDRIIGTASINEESGAAYTALEVKFYGENIKHVFDELTLGVAATMYISADGSGVSFIQDGVLFSLQPLSE